MRRKAQNIKTDIRPGFWMMIVFLATISSCIEPFEAEVEEEPQLISIEGSLIKGDALQWIVVSRSTSLDNPRLIPVSGCVVSVIDELNNEFIYNEHSAGRYLLEVADDDLVTGRSYMLSVATPDGNLYVTDYEELVSGVEIDSVYYNVEDRIETISGAEISGIQFYIDIEAPESESRFFRWRLLETYEFNSIGPIDYFYYDDTQTPYPPADMWAVFQCWKTDNVPGEFLSNTINLTVNEKKRIPLNYVSNKTERLKIKYSLLVSQYSLSEDAFNYFQLNKIVLEESGGLYTRQPRQPITNIYNFDDSEERVLGYFWLSTRSDVRLFVPRINGMDVQAQSCAIEEWNDEDHGDGPFPMYIMEIDGVRYTSASYCFDCTKRGGSITRPVFWE